MTIDGLAHRAGWYPDPESSTGERWWNGSQWTSHTRADAALAIPFEPSGAPPLAWSADDVPLATIAPTAKAEYVAAPHLPSPLAIPPGWYPDPAGLPAQRWWDGSDWTGYQAPMVGSAGRGGTTFVVLAPPKSAGIALLLTFFFGPLGMLYSTVSGALIMLAVSLIGSVMVAVVTFGLGLFLWWPAIWLASMIWGTLAAADRPPTQIINAYR